MDQTQPAAVSKTLFALAAVLAGAFLLGQLSTRPAIAAQPVALATPTMHEGVDWSRVPAAPVSPGATVGAYDR